MEYNDDWAAYICKHLEGDDAQSDLFFWPRFRQDSVGGFSDHRFDFQLDALLCQPDELYADASTVYAPST